MSTAIAIVTVNEHGRLDAMSTVFVIGPGAQPAALWQVPERADLPDGSQSVQFVHRIANALWESGYKLPPGHADADDLKADGLIAFVVVKEN